jgi:hypothetical protein
MPLSGIFKWCLTRIAASLFCDGVLSLQLILKNATHIHAKKILLIVSNFIFKYMGINQDKNNIRAITVPIYLNEKNDCLYEIIDYCI